MTGLKAAFERQGFSNVVTYINSGNILFHSEIIDETALKITCEQRIRNDFGLDIAVCVILTDDFREAFQHAQKEWNDAPEAIHSALFIIPPMTAAELCARVGELNPEYEKVDYFGKVIFWSASLPWATYYRQSRWHKILNDKSINYAITQRGANTAIKLAELAGDSKESSAN